MKDALARLLARGGADEAPAGLTAKDVYTTAQKYLTGNAYDPTARTPLTVPIPLTGANFTTYLPSDLDQAQAFERQAANAPTLEEQRAGLLNRIRAIRAQRDQSLDALPPPQQEMLPNADLPALSLPTPPVRQSPRLDPAASIGAAVLGLVAPQHAGQFGAAALRASLDANEQQTQDAQRKYAEDYRQAVARHEDGLTRENVKRRIEMENSDRRYQNSAADLKRKMEASMREAERNELGAEADSLTSSADKSKPARASALDAKNLRERIDLKAAQSAGRQKVGENLLGVASGLQKAEDTNAARTYGVDARTLMDIMKEGGRNERQGNALGVSAAKGGFTYDPGTGSIVPTGEDKLPELVKARLDQMRAGTAKTKADTTNAAKLLKANPRYAALDRDERAQVASLKALESRALNSVRGNLRFQALPPDEAAAYITQLVDKDPNAAAIRKVVADIQGEKRQILDGVMQAAPPVGSAPAAFAASSGKKGKTLDPATAQKLFQEAGRNPERARALARQRGYLIPVGQ